MSAASGLGTVVRASELHVSRPTWWLESRFHFNFAGYSGGEEQWGVLRVVNDDIVQGKAGFGPHPHSFYSIFSYVVDGELTHQDSMGNKETLGRGAIQFMSAGTGVRHSEMNDGDDPVRFLQIWIESSARGLEPEYGSVVFAADDRADVLLHAINGRENTVAAGHASTISLPQDVNVFVSELSPDASVAYALGRGRQLYLVCIEGTVTVRGGDAASELGARDALKLVGGADVAFDAGAAGAHFLFVEMAESG